MGQRLKFLGVWLFFHFIPTAPGMAQELKFRIENRATIRTSLPGGVLRTHELLRLSMTGLGIDSVELQIFNEGQWQSAGQSFFHILENQAVLDLRSISLQGSQKIRFIFRYRGERIRAFDKTVVLE